MICYNKLCNILKCTLEELSEKVPMKESEQTRLKTN